MNMSLFRDLFKRNRELFKLFRGLFRILLHIRELFNHRFNNHRDMPRRHAISPGFCSHYRDLGIPSRKRHDSACKLILIAWFTSLHLDSAAPRFTVHLHDGLRVLAREDLAPGRGLLLE